MRVTYRILAYACAERIVVANTAAGNALSPGRRTCQLSTESEGKIFQNEHHPVS